MLSLYKAVLDLPLFRSEADGTATEEADAQ